MQDFHTNQIIIGRSTQSKLDNRSEKKPYPPLEVPSIITAGMDYQTNKAAQKADPTLSSIRDYVKNHIVHEKEER